MRNPDIPICPWWQNPPLLITVTAGGEESPLFLTSACGHIFEITPTQPSLASTSSLKCGNSLGSDIPPLHPIHPFIISQTDIYLIWSPTISCQCLFTSPLSYLSDFNGFLDPVPTWPFLSEWPLWNSSSLMSYTSINPSRAPCSRTMGQVQTLWPGIQSPLPSGHSISPGLPDSISSLVYSMLTKAPGVPQHILLLSTSVSAILAFPWDGLPYLVSPEDSCSSFQTWMDTSIYLVMATILPVTMLYCKDFFPTACFPPLDSEPLGGRAFSQFSLHSQSLGQCLTCRRCSMNL